MDAAMILHSNDLHCCKAIELAVKQLKCLKKAEICIPLSSMIYKFNKLGTSTERNGFILI